MPYRSFNKTILFGALLLSAGAFLPCRAQAETLNVPFNISTGVTTSQLYSGLVHIEVSGTGSAFFADDSDAFYFVYDGSETSPTGNFQLAMIPASRTFVGENDGQGGATSAIRFDIVSIDGVGPVTPGTIPAYRADNTYRFVVQVPNATPTALTFGVNDGDYTDNGGAFTVTVTQIPEPSTAALVGAAALGLAAFRRRRTSLNRR